ncbi:MAG: hypothetical protein E7653_06540 [Ruminococcaceae bacterium]|nr:hypothetical protein [Oscillospiraceae bacterium]
MIKNGKDIQVALNAIKASGGKVHLGAGSYELESSIVVDTPSSKLEGDVWAYNLDPNGVFETPYGTKLRLIGRDFPAVSVGVDNVPAGAMVCDIGIQGDIKGMDTRGLLDIENPSHSAGLYFGSQRVDQGQFSKISCCGLATAVCAADNSELDACSFEKINMDGCCIGVYFAPRASYYAHFRQCVVADTPSYGFFFDGTNSKIHNVDITDIHFVRNCGSSPIENEEPCAVYFKNISSCIFRDNLVDFPGVFWYYVDDATSNEQRQIQKNKAIGLKIIGDKNRILGNTFMHSTREAIVIEGNENILMTNIVDADVVIEGEGNVVNGLVFTKPNARLVLKGKAKDTTVILGVEENRIVRE